MKFLVLAVGLWLSQSSPAALLTFNAGSGNVDPGGDVVVPITVSGSAGKDWISAQFQLVWDTDVLTITSYNLQDLLPGSTFNPASGVFSWFDSTGSGVDVTNSSTLLAATFTAAGDAPLSPPTYSISFAPSPEVGFLDGSSENPATVAGTITVVPEPVNAALCLLASTFLGAAAARRVWRTKSAAR